MARDDEESVARQGKPERPTDPQTRGPIDPKKQTPSFARRLDGVGISLIRQIMGRAGEACVSLGIGEPEFFAPWLVREEAARILAEEKILYSPNAGLPELCAAVHRYHGAHEGHAVCVANGSQEALFDLLFALVDPGDEVLIPNPGFVAYETVTRLVGGVPAAYRMPRQNGFRFSREEFLSAISPRCKAVILNSPSNPTSQVVSLKDLEWIAETVERSGLFLISDEIYREIHYLSKKPPTMADVTDRAVVLSGLSKMASMTGWRIGWACGPAEIIEKATVAHQYTSSCASTLAQKAALKVFTEKGRRAIEDRRLALDANRRLMCGRLAELGRPFVAPQGAFYVLISVEDLGLDGAVALALLEDGVATIPGAAFGSESEGFLRLSFAGCPETIETGLERLRRGLKRLRR